MGECPWETVARKEVSLGKGGTRMGDARWEKVRLVVVRDNKLVMQRVLEKGKNKYGQNKNPCMPPCQTRKKSMPNSCLRLLQPETVHDSNRHASARQPDGNPNEAIHQ